MSDDPRLAELEQRLGYRFRDSELLFAAVTHRSASSETGADHYERLEFLGDAVLGLLTAEWLFASLPDQREGTLARLKSHLVSARALAQHARDLEVGDALILGEGEDRSGGREKPSLLADSMEALIGAVFLDGGLEPARSIVGPFLESTLQRNPDALDLDAKTDLQEWLQGRGEGLPEYRLTEESGPAHERIFEVECWALDRVMGSGRGRSKKAAERRAASDALARIRANTDNL